MEGHRSFYTEGLHRCHHHFEGNFPDSPPSPCRLQVPPTFEPNDNQFEVGSATMWNLYVTSTCWAEDELLTLLWRYEARKIRCIGVKKHLKVLLPRFRARYCSTKPQQLTLVCHECYTKNKHVHQMRHAANEELNEHGTSHSLKDGTNKQRWQVWGTWID